MYLGQEFGCKPIEMHLRVGDKVNKHIRNLRVHYVTPLVHLKGGTVIINVSQSLGFTGEIKAMLLEFPEALVYIVSRAARLSGDLSPNHPLH